MICFSVLSALHLTVAGAFIQPYKTALLSIYLVLE